VAPTSISFAVSPDRWDGRGVLHRALRDDVPFRFVALGGAGERYDVVLEAGTPDVEGGVVLIEPFLAAWGRLRAARAEQRGYLGTRLYRSVAAAAEPGFVDVTRWSSPLMFARASALPDVEQATAAMPFASQPALYLAGTSALRR
jgi:hypothetical protein